MLNLRPYQHDLIARTREAIASGCRNPLVVAPTGAGKTALTAYMIGSAARKDWRCWFVVHRDELLQQSHETFDAVGIPHGYIASGYYSHDRSARVHLVSIATVARRLHRVAPPDLIVLDEAHHSVSNTWTRMLEAFPNAIRVGLSATPQRLDGRGLSQHFGRLIEGPTVADLISQGYLSRFKIFAPSAPSVQGVHTRGGDYARDELAAIVDKPTIVGDVVQHYLRLARGRRFLCRAVSIEHSQHLAAQFVAAGVPCVHVDGNTDATVRRMAMRDLRSGALMGLTNVDLFSEGVDVPGIEAIVDVRPTQSLTLAMQFWGRGLRIAEGKSHAVILDHAGNCFRHGLPDDVRDWSLEGAARKVVRSPDDSGTLIRQCKTCYAANRRTATVCVECGAAFCVEPRKVAKRDGDLREITDIERQQLARERRREEGRAQTLEELQAIAAARGYKPQWAHIRWNMRQRRRATA